MDIQSLVIPISLGRFVNQIAAYLLLHRGGYKPDIIYSASGGSIATLILCSSNFENDHEEFERIVFSLTDMVGPNNTFKDHPWSINIINPLVRYLQIPGLYNHGDPLPDSFYKYNIDCTPELWVLTHSYEENRHFLWTNKSESIAEPITNKKGYFKDFRTFEKVVRAASAIPSHTIPVKIDQKHYLDAGGGISSPFEYFTGNYRQRLLYKMVYLSPLQIDRNSYPFKIYPVLDIFGTITTKIAHDRIYEELYLHRLIFDKLSNGKIVEKDEGILPDYPTEIVNKIKSANISLLIIYPIDDLEIRFLSFNTGDITNLVKKSLNKKFRYEHLYVL